MLQEERTAATEASMSNVGRRGTGCLSGDSSVSCHELEVLGGLQVEEGETSVTRQGDAGEGHVAS